MPPCQGLPVTAFPDGVALRLYSKTRRKPPMQRKWLEVFLVSAGALHAQYAKAPDAYSLTQTNSMFGPTATMEIARDGNRVVVDNTINASHTRTIYDLATSKTFSVDL